MSNKPIYYLPEKPDIIVNEDVFWTYIESLNWKDLNETPANYACSLLINKVSENDLDAINRYFRTYSYDLINALTSVIFPRILFHEELTKLAYHIIACGKKRAAYTIKNPASVKHLIGKTAIDDQFRDFQALLRT